MSTAPDVVLVVLDSVRAASTSLGGAGTTPNLERLAERGCVYERAYAPSCWTLPSHASLFTGLPVRAHGVGGPLRDLRAVPAPALAETLSARGYATVGASANPWVGPAFGFDRGFDVFHCGWLAAGGLPDLAAASLANGGASRRGKLEALVRSGPSGAAGALPAYLRARARRRGRFGGRRLARRFLRSLGEAGGSRPVFGFLNLLEAHRPYNPPARRRRAAGVSRAAAVDAGRIEPWAFVAGASPASEEQLDVLRRLYEAEVGFVDELLGEVVRELDARRRRTLLVVTADHGENLGEHGLMDHQFSLHETVLHVPLVVRYPDGGLAGERTGVPVELERLFGTLESGGARILEPGGRAIAEYPSLQPSLARLQATVPGASFASVDRRLRALVRADGRKAIWASDGRHAVYDLLRDPAERTNLHPSPAADALLAELARHFESDGPAPSPPPDGPESEGRDVRAALEALGYL